LLCCSSSYCTIACTLARQPCPAALPGSLARQPSTYSLALQPCLAALKAGSLVQAFHAINIANLSHAYKLIFERG
jgi:hypothetical protein